MDQIKVRVSTVEQVAPMIREYSLVATSTALYPFSPGAHVMVEMNGTDKTFRNAYSLLNDSMDSSVYRIAVRLQDDSRGGSAFMHQQVKVGDELLISPPSNLFAPIWQAKKHLLIAAGVGITPFMSYLPEMQRRGCDIELHYLFRGEQTGAYQDKLTKQLGEVFFSYDSDLGRRCQLKTLLADQPLGTHIYICGPASLIESTKFHADEMGIPQSCIHYEEFARPQPGTPFVVEIKSTGQTVSVGAEESMLEALETALVKVPSLCRGGVCGQCICPVAQGEIEHRDGFLSDTEKAQGEWVMPCVSRAQSERLVLDI
jgi:ferredoxin-NADP reductase